MYDRSSIQLDLALHFFGSNFCQCVEVCILAVSS
jgi:hypothetical protein